jgi:hypothetical protein
VEEYYSPTQKHPQLLPYLGEGDPSNARVEEYNL